MGGLAGAISPAIFGGLGGNTALGFSFSNFFPAVGAGAVTGAVTGGMSTAFYGGSFGVNVGVGTLSGAGFATIVYSVGAAWERYFYGKDVTNTPEVQEALGKYQKRFPNENIADIRVFKGGAGLPAGHYAITAWGENEVVLAEATIDGSREIFLKVMGHELSHVASDRASPDYRIQYEAFSQRFGRFANPYEIVAEHRGSVFASEIMGYHVPMNPFFRQ